MAWAVSCAPSSAISKTATAAPSAASNCAVARPMPAAAPVTMALRWLKRLMGYAPPGLAGDRAADSTNDRRRRTSKRDDNPDPALRRVDFEAAAPLGVEAEQARAVLAHHLAYLGGGHALEQRRESQGVCEALGMRVVRAEDHSPGAQRFDQCRHIVLGIGGDEDMLAEG